MTITKAQQIGIITTLIFSVINALLPIWKVGKNSDFFQEFFFLENQINRNFLDLFIPILIIFSIFLGRTLGELILIKGEKEIFYHTTRVILNVVGMSLFFTISLRYTYTFLTESISNGYFQHLVDIFHFLGELLLSYLYIFLSILVFYLFNLLPSSLCGLFQAGVLRLIKK